ncbi:Plasma Membrane Calcium-Transporting Atpase 2 [Manis pentadactyla]|nr:Plasma Membrane Calcium-Transporting Atpase 2 [Manis pentadactyla]
MKKQKCLESVTHWSGWWAVFSEDLTGERKAEDETEPTAAGDRQRELHEEAPMALVTDIRIIQGTQSPSSHHPPNRNNTGCWRRERGETRRSRGQAEWGPTEECNLAFVCSARCLFPVQNNDLS